MLPWDRTKSGSSRIKIKKKLNQRRKFNQKIKKPNQKREKPNQSQRSHNNLSKVEAWDLE
jgi:hypothetical protein